MVAPWRKKFFKHVHPDKNGNYKCAVCAGPVHIDVVTVDHIVDRNVGGSQMALANMQPAHGYCNRLKAYIEDDMRTWIRWIDEECALGPTT